VPGKALELHFTEWLEGEGIRWSTNPDEFVEQDDISTLTAMRSSSDPHARAVVERNHFPLAYQSGEHLSEQETIELAAVIERVKAQFAPHQVLVSHAAKDPHRFEQERVWVQSEHGSLIPMQKASHFIGHLERIDRFRVYTPRPLTTDVENSIRRELP
jgi:hypothetical protein